MINLKYFMNESPKCPHCNNDYDIWNGDYIDYDLREDAMNEVECPSCEKTFVFKNHIAHSFSTSVTEEDLLNDLYGLSKGEA